MFLPLVGLLVGVLLGLVLGVKVDLEVARYSGVAILAALDSVLGAVRAELDGAFWVAARVSRNARLEAYLGLARDRSWSKAEPSLSAAGNQRLLSALGSISCLVPGQVIIDGVRVAGERAAEANFGIGENRASEFGWEHKPIG